MTFVEISPDTELLGNRYGIQEPVSGETVGARELDIVLLPLLGFDICGNRIGMGGGYYDRAFSFLKNRECYLRPKLIGLAYASQRLDEISPSPWDIPLFRVVTESQL